MLRSPLPPTDWSMFLLKVILCLHKNSNNNNKNNGHCNSQPPKNRSIKPAFLNQEFTASPKVSRTTERAVSVKGAVITPPQRTRPLLATATIFSILHSSYLPLSSSASPCVAGNFQKPPPLAGTKILFCGLCVHVVTSFCKKEIGCLTLQQVCFCTWAPMANSRPPLGSC